VAAKLRRQRKKVTSGASRRTSKSSPAAVRRTAPKKKVSGSGKPKANPKAKGAKRRMTAKTSAARPAPSHKKQAPRTVKKANEHAKKPAEQIRKAVSSTKSTPTARPKAIEPAKKPVEHHKKPAEQIRKPVEQATAAKKAPEQPVLAKKPSNQRQGFKTHEFIVYPAHGVGQIVAIEEQDIAGFKLELFVISFAKDKMILRVPTTKVASVGMRKLAEPAVVRRALDTLKGRARIKRTMWSRRAQEYEAKINSGDIVAIAEVVRDLYRSETQPEQSYSERQLYEAALDRLAREIASVERITETEAVKEIEAALAKGPRRGPKPAEGEAEAEEEAFVAEEAA
jgi:CarD family transcriptional regulator